MLRSTCYNTLLEGTRRIKVCFLCVSLALGREVVQLNAWRAASVEQVNDFTISINCNNVLTEYRVKEKKVV